LDAEDFGRRERCRDFDGEIGGLRLAGLLLNGLYWRKRKISESFGWYGAGIEELTSSATVLKASSANVKKRKKPISVTQWNDE
ncbi:MAG: hypothetical protein Q9180_000857, partial [Flavoplaca navasiana]